MAASDHLNASQFGKVVTDKPTDDNGWIGPLGSYGEPSPAGSLYGYGVGTMDPGMGRYNG